MKCLYWDDGYPANIFYPIWGTLSESVDELQALVHDKFSSITNTGRKAEKFIGQPGLPGHLQVKPTFNMKCFVDCLRIAGNVRLLV